MKNAHFASRTDGILGGRRLREILWRKIKIIKFDNKKRRQNCQNRFFNVYFLKFKNFGIRFFYFNMEFEKLMTALHAAAFCAFATNVSRF